LTVPEYNEASSHVDRSKSRERRLHEQRTMFKPHEMGSQVTCSMDTEMPTKNTLRTTPQESRRCVPQPCLAEGELGAGREFTTRSCANADFDTTEICGIASGWLYERKKRDSSSSNVPWPAKEL